MANKAAKLENYVSIADVAVTKRHQRRDEIRIIFTLTSSKSCFQKKIVMQYVRPQQRNPVRTAHACALAINTRVSHSIRLLEMHTFPTEKQLY